MARSTKSSKSSTKQPEETDQSATEDQKPGEDEISADVVVSESVEDQALESDSESATDTSVGANDPDSETESSGSEPEFTDSDPVTDAADSGETPSVPGVIPAHVESTPPPPAAVAASGPGALGLVLGGIVAGAIGFLVATYAVPEGWPNPVPSGVDELESTLSEQSERLDALATDLAAFRDAPAATQGGSEMSDLAPMAEQLAQVETQFAELIASVEGSLADVGSQLESFESRLAGLEARPLPPAGADGSAAMEAQMEAFRQQLDEVTADAEARIAEAQSRASEIEAEAAAAAKTAERAAALTSLKAALESGAAFESTLAVFEDVPQALSSVSADGIPTLSSLQASFPDAARAALAQAQTVPESASAADRFVAFLKRRTNARSLTPQDGDDPDAVLSRSEAALADGELESALSELEALPESAYQAMSDWISAAETRVAAIGAAASLENATN